MTVGDIQKIVLSTGNILSAGVEVVRKPSAGKSNLELLDSLRSSFVVAGSSKECGSSEGVGNNSTRNNNASSGEIAGLENSNGRGLTSWTSLEAGTLFVPSKHQLEEGLYEKWDEYDITVKLFFLPNDEPTHRGRHAREALEFILNVLQVAGVNLLIISFPSVSFDANDESHDSEPSKNEVEEWARTYHALEDLHREGLIRKIGLSEFGSSRLAKLLPLTRVKPSVNQINVRDCCVVPKSLIVYAREQGIELLTHNDCTDILPEGTLKRLLAEEFDIVKAENEIKPQWVAKYTAVIRDRGVVENKGYFAMADVIRGK